MAQLAQLRTLSKEIQDAIDAQAAGKDGSMRRVYEAATKLRRASEPPATTVLRQPYHTIQNLALMLAIDMGLLRTLVQNACAPETMTAEALAKETGYDEVLVMRIMRVATSTGFANEVGVRTYQANPVTELQDQPGHRATWLYTNDWFFSFGLKIREYVEHIRHAKPEDYPVPFDFGHGMSIWSYISNTEHVDEAKEFSSNMAMRTKLYAVPWHVKYPLLQELGQKDLQSTKIIDMGGNIGHDLQGVIDGTDFPGQLILQDLPVQIERARQLISPRIQGMPYDFFTPQPIKGAAIYHIKGCLHNWSDSKVVQILSNTAQAMNAASRFLINELVLKDVGETDVNRADMDIEMFFVNGSMERTILQWQELVSKTIPNIRIAKIWTVPEDDQSILELRLDV